MKSLKSYMRKNKLSNAKMADKLGVHYRLIYNWSRGASRPRVETAILLERITKGEVSVYSWE